MRGILPRRTRPQAHLADRLMYSMTRPYKPRHIPVVRLYHPLKLSRPGHLQNWVWVDKQGLEERSLIRLEE